MNNKLIRPKIESGWLGFVASMIGVAGLLLFPTGAFVFSSYDLQVNVVAAGFAVTTLLMLIGGSILGSLLSIYAILAQRARIAVWGLIIGGIACLFIPTYLLSVIRMFR